MLQQLENEALRIDRALIIEIERTAYLLESISRQIDTQTGDMRGQLSRLLESFSQNKALKSSEFYWVNAEQKVQISGGLGRLDKPVDVSDRDYMKRAITTPWTVHIGQPIEGRVSGRWLMPMALGVTDEQGEFLGAVSIGLNIESLSGVISGVIKGAEIDYAITNQAFTLLTQVASSPDFFAKNFSLTRLSKIDFTQDAEGVFSQASWMRDDDIYAYYERSSQYPYLIFVGYDAQVSREEIGRILLPRLMQVGVMTLFLILTLWTVRKRIIQPVMRLTQDTQAILHGKGVQHDASADPVEIGELAEAITKLGDYLHERRCIERELVAKNADLIKVKEAAEMTNHLKANFFEQVGEALHRPAKAIDEYVASMRDELFGPLGSEKYLEMTEAMQQQSDALMETLEDIKAISKAETGLLALNEMAVDLNFAINKCVRILREKANSASVEIILDLDDEIPKVLVDELRFKQLILSVISFASREVDAGATVRLSSVLAPDEVRIEVSYKPILQSLTASLQARDAKLAATQVIKLGRALNELIVAMHGGRLMSKPLPDGTLKQIISLPDSRIIRKT